MKNNLTELVFILDKSGSMAGLESDTIGGFNSMLEKQKAVEGECTLTTVLFDDKFELLHDRINIHAVSKLTNKEYQVRGSTALLDAIGLTIQKIDKVQESVSEEYRASNIMFVIITDGEENSSHQFSYGQIQKLISDRRELSGWEFIFLGANIDAISAAKAIGIEANRAQNFHADRLGVEVVFESVADAAVNMREAKCIPCSWNKGVEEDFKKRPCSKKK